ncbi:hypothetical protein [Enterovibrio norvegicus]|uniref:hypothetical protein n=1 Tax=Enterovibrio norvegicus TaxID=188144 RepID=UPI000C83103A|nr:hypothetical protein [Enterovibrio norvegicus]PMH64480.1 hypothetical protein BCU62_15610 [Enterovibrio norvegicus]
MEVTDIYKEVAFLSLAGFAITLIRHLLFKRELMRLKRDMKQHTLTNGIDDALWDMFVQRTRKMLSFWR